MSCGDIFLGVLAIVFPPIAVWIKCGVCSCDSLLNLLLCTLGYLPGLIHAWYIIAKFPDPDYDLVATDDPEAHGGSGRRVAYYYVAHQPLSPGSTATGQPDGGRAHRHIQRGGSNYGTLNAGLAGASQQPASPGMPPQHTNTAAPPPAADGPAGRDSAATPPTYAEAVRGDHKVQTD